MRLEEDRDYYVWDCGFTGEGWYQALPKRLRSDATLYLQALTGQSRTRRLDGELPRHVADMLARQMEVPGLACLEALAAKGVEQIDYDDDKVILLEYRQDLREEIEIRIERRRTAGAVGGRRSAESRRMKYGSARPGAGASEASASGASEASAEAGHEAPAEAAPEPTTTLGGVARHPLEPLGVLDTQTLTTPTTQSGPARARGPVEKPPPLSSEEVEDELARMAGEALRRAPRPREQRRIGTIWFELYVGSPWGAGCLSLPEIQAALDAWSAGGGRVRSISDLEAALEAARAASRAALPPDFVPDPSPDVGRERARLGAHLPALASRLLPPIPAPAPTPKVVN